MAAAARISPGQRIAGSIAFLVVFGLILVFLFGTPTDEYEKTKACTAEMTGTVQTVRRHYHTGRSGGYTYEADVLPAESGVFQYLTVTSLHSGHKYREGETVKIFYDPSDSSNSYVQYARPGDSFKYGIMFFLPALLINGILIFRAVRDKRRGEM